MNFLRRFLTALAFTLFCLPGFAQDTTGAVTDFRVSSKKLSDSTYQLKFTGIITPGWDVYAPGQELSGLKTTELQFPDSSIMVGEINPGGGQETVNSSIFSMAVNVQRKNIEWTSLLTINGTVPARLQGMLLYTYGRDNEFYPSTPINFVVDMEGGVVAGKSKVASIDIKKAASPCGDDGTEDKGILTIFFLGFVGGLIALLTPCVFPMIPVTVQFFTRKTANRAAGIRNALLYGFFIFVIYVLITIPFHIIGNVRPEIFNNISTNVPLNLLFFAIFILFALSFFGLFEIGLPSSLANKADSKSGIGNIAGIFFMAGTLAIVSFSCTGPILGTLLANAATGAWSLTAGAAGFGIALGLPFALFAMFPNWLQSLPRSGGWMTDVKVVLAFLELALAVKFFSNADLVQQWGLLKREVFIGLWIVFSFLTVLYLLGVIRIGHSSPVKRFSPARIFFIVLFSAITVYLIPGLTNTKWADLKLISGFPPPRTTYSIYSDKEGKKNLFEPIQNDYQQALRLGREQNKPVLIDFTGWACVNCRKMEEKVWHQKEVDSMMRKEFIVVSLYVDERRKLPLQEQTVDTMSNGSVRSIVTVGDKWSAFQIENFGATSQPQYAIITPDQTALTKTKFYTPDAEEFAEWLKCGLDTWKNSRK